MRVVVSPGFGLKRCTGLLSGGEECSWDSPYRAVWRLSSLQRLVFIITELAAGSPPGLFQTSILYQMKEWALMPSWVLTEYKNLSSFIHWVGLEKQLDINIRTFTRSYHKGGDFQKWRKPKRRAPDYLADGGEAAAGSIWILTSKIWGATENLSWRILQWRIPSFVGLFVWMNLLSI